MRTRHAQQPAEPWGVPGAAPERRQVVICTHKHTEKTCRGACVHIHTLADRHTHRLHPTPPLHRRSCPVLTGAHLPQPEAINTTTAPPTYTPFTQHSSSAFPPHFPLLLLLTQPASLCLPLLVCLFAFVSEHSTSHTTMQTHTSVLYKRILPWSSAVMKCIFLPLIQLQNSVCRNGF